MKRRLTGQKRRKRIAAAIVTAAMVSAALCLWVWLCEKKAHIVPEVQRVSIGAILERAEWTENDLAVLREQTGLSAAVLCTLNAQGRREELTALQESYFAPVRIDCMPNSVLTREEYLVNESGQLVRGMKIPVVEDGDILVTYCSHALGWRNGHAAIVVDAGRRLVLEAQVLGMPTVVVPMDRWECYPSFLVLRLRDASEEERRQIAAYAEETLSGIPYRLTAGLWPAEEVSGTQCAHLVWYAYREFGYDLDGDGGWIVTPHDLAESELLEVIQRYGM